MSRCGTAWHRMPLDPPDRRGVGRLNAAWLHRNSGGRLARQWRSQRGQHVQRGCCAAGEVRLGACRPRAMPGREQLWINTTTTCPRISQSAPSPAVPSPSWTTAGSTGPAARLDHHSHRWRSGFATNRRRCRSVTTSQTAGSVSASRERRRVRPAARARQRARWATTRAWDETHLVHGDRCGQGSKAATQRSNALGPVAVLVTVPPSKSTVPRNWPATATSRRAP